MAEPAAIDPADLPTVVYRCRVATQGAVLHVVSLTEPEPKLDDTGVLAGVLWTPMAIDGSDRLQYVNWASVVAFSFRPEHDVDAIRQLFGLPKRQLEELPGAAMRVCGGCGCEIAVARRRCQHCGSTSTRKPRAKKNGSSRSREGIRHCPGCGAIVGSNLRVCPSCSFDELRPSA
ncbi:MAG: hypothetical protein KDC27_17600 [Acidobacteria bacterium]|nr:hypothetical protein [Acidobacteriota bacterium]